MPAMILKLKCNYSDEPYPVDSEDILFTATTEGGECDSFLFELMQNGEPVYRRRTEGKIFWPLRLQNFSLQENTDYTWRVRAFFKDREVADAQRTFVTAFRPRLAKWIADPTANECVSKFRKEFFVREGCEKAALFICGLGFFEANVNGKQTDRWYFKPLFTDYEARDICKNRSLSAAGEHTVSAYVFDILPHLNAGRDNFLEVLLGNGYYHNEDKLEEPFVSFGQKKVIFEIRLTYPDGEEIFYSDEGTKACKTGMLSDLFAGNHLDFTKADTELRPCAAVQNSAGRFIFPRLHADVAQEISPVNIRQEQKGMLVDFGLNHTGDLSFKIRGKRGQRLTLHYAETLDADGRINRETGVWEAYNIQKDEMHRIEQTSVYILSGNVDQIRPLFSWRCYRYVLFENFGDAEIFELKSLFLHTDIACDGKFSCSNALFNRICDASVLTMLDNLHCGIISDCPHREKRPYTGDGQIVAEAMFYAFDSQPLYEKWLADILCAQRKDGFVPYSAPYLGGGGGYAWSLAIAVVPDILYRFTGDKFYIEKSYRGLYRWIGFCQAHARENIVEDNGERWMLGDWLAPEMSVFNVRLMNTLCYYISVITAMKFASFLGKHQEEAELSRQSREIADAINREFFDWEKCQYANGVQGENLYPLVLDIVPRECRERLIERVQETYTGNNYHLDTGIVMTPILFQALIENGMEEIAYRILDSRSYPSYAKLLEGESTLPEHWSKKWPDYCINGTSEIVKGGGELSHCHPMFGSVIAVLYKYVAGLDLSYLYRGKVIVAPRFTQFMEFASAEKETTFGRAAVDWRKKSGLLYLRVTVPSGLEGEIHLPGVHGGYLLMNEKASHRIMAAGKPVSIQVSAGEWTLLELSESRCEEIVNEAVV